MSRQMHAFPVNTEADYQRALDLIGVLWDVDSGTPESDLLQVMAELVERYEKRHRALPPAPPADVLRLKMAELKWSGRELARRLGWGAGRVSEVLNGRRSLTLQMVRDLARVLRIDPGLLVHDACVEEGFVRAEIGQHTELALRAYADAEGIRLEAAAGLLIERGLVFERAPALTRTTQ